MRSSPNFLAVNRREVDGQLPEREVVRRRRDEISLGDLEITLKVSYKTLALVFLIFNVLSHIIDSLL
ncbi:hypothetical protein QIP14_gp3 [ssRNA phage Esthiorhiza.2_41]|uniref:Uncharacterized protein n=2 Tax=Leviviricetes TaxID=2842243 RepID=A0A8S5L1Q8_9VIRU|nr:hypothetical protein QIP14_gp3 [ssRNA phage Esthiorhiza.2_41]QDH88166.1 MAG: hypothetical protein H2RhizoLitter49951_000003 [Leviviridae sp.]DAD51359.1 TPA_asm: hypothetical protein [ssRNA phage Esthiorhiza.2_41]